MNAFFMTARKTKLLVTSLLLSAALISTSCGDGADGRNITIPGVIGPTVTLVEDNVLISMVFENLQVQGGLRYNIPKYTHSYIELSPDFNSTGTLMAVSVSLKDVFDGGLQQLPPQTLPGGRALPGVVGGRLPAVAFSIPQFHNLGVYLGPKVFGLFVPTGSLGIGQSIATFRFYSSGTRTGNISLVGEDANGENSGVLLLLDMGDSVKKRLAKIANKYN
ncbi:MAG: hypothetical protein COW01_16210 [Bdellovibrionales bacterium CG12_big_fil_rev_8_21_14_0_65_38_15]|nr:MAG: hypothetical protein COW79_15375 [Bdellovibrionales bacterium CG22_combo_CG10-13_8_21_14_all_38_13]PIQ52509.1 MAG: hypothetical protein COW01_16210 [Bdellovibrionales bacterium CG12_big_fil_rev_8_21_14_0_65_38_15]